MKIAEYKNIDYKIETIRHEAIIDDEHNIVEDARYEEIKKPIMGMVYREETEEERIAREKAEEAYLNSEEYRNEQIRSLKEELASYDYIGTKIAMGVATREDYADKIAYTEELRRKIRELED